MEAAAIDYSGIAVAQLTFHYPETELFYQRNNIPLAKTYLFPVIDQDVESALYTQAMLTITMPPVLKQLYEQTDGNFAVTSPHEVFEAIKRCYLFFEKTMGYCQRIIVDLTEEQLTRLGHYLQIIQDHMQWDMSFQEKDPIFSSASLHEDPIGSRSSASSVSPSLFQPAIDTPLALRRPGPPTASASNPTNVASATRLTKTMSN